MRYAVAHINFFENNLVVELHEASSEREALLLHSSIRGCSEYDDIPETREEIQNYFFDGDAMVDVVIIPE